MLHPEVLPIHALALLKTISPVLAEEGFFLAGGTALALRLGHRMSDDLDFFSDQEFNPLELSALLAKASGAEPEIKQQTRGSLGVSIGKTTVELLHYPYPLLAKAESVDEVMLYSLADNGAMKLSAMTNRGSKKDFIDIAALLEIRPLDGWLTYFKKKYPHTDIFTVIKSLTWFEDAEIEPDPVLLQKQTWESVKHTITQAVAGLEG